MSRRAARPAPTWRTFPRTSVYRMGAMGRFGLRAAALLALALAAAIWPAVVDDPSHPTASAVAGIGAILAALGVPAALFVRYAANRRFVLTPQDVTAHALGAGVTLPFSRIAAATATRAPRSTQYKVRLHADDGTRGLTLHVEDFHLRDDALYHWLGAIPRRGGVEPRPPATPRPSTFERVVTLLAVVPILALVAFLGSLDIGIARDLADGYPPLERLSVVQGAVTEVSACERVGHGRTQITVAMEDGGVPGSEVLDCRYEPALRDPATAPHRLAVWRDRRRFADGDIRQIDLDGRTLVSYADELVTRRAVDPSKMVSHALLVAAMALVAVGLVASLRDRAPSER